ncbi:MAG: DUF1127 domain-containing protein [Aliishimia sp.]
MTHARHSDAIHFLSNRPLTPVSTLALQAVVTFVKWEERRRTRNALKHLDDHLLEDIGLTRHAARKEVSLPFWRG